VFTASQRDYAEPILNFLDPKEEIFDYRFYREMCLTASDGRYVKDLRIFGGRKLKDIVIVDNSAFSFGEQIENGVPIIPFIYDKRDKEFLKLQKYLELILESYDVRTFNKEAFKLHKCHQYQNH